VAKQEKYDDATTPAPHAWLSVDEWVLDEVPLERLEAEIAGFAAHLAAASAKWLVWVGAYDRREGWRTWETKSCAHWLNLRCGMSLRTGREQVRVARRLEHLPLVRECFLAGRISYSKVRAVSRGANADNEADLLSVALAGTASQLERICGALRRADGDELAETEDAEINKRVSWENNHDGSASITITAPVADIKRAHGALQAAAEDELNRRRNEGESNLDAIQRLGGIGCLQAETALAVIDGTIDSVEPPSQDTLVVVEFETVAGANNDGESTVDGARIAPVVAERLSCDSNLQIALRGSTGQALGVGRSSRIVPQRIRRLMLRRDNQMCQFPACGSTRRLHAHHVVHWSKGGTTDLGNLITICHQHHRTVHERRWNIYSTPSGFTFTDPAGIRQGVLILTDPLPNQSIAQYQKCSAEHLAAPGEPCDTRQIADTIHQNALTRRSVGS